MGASFNKDSDEPIVDINITPFVDIILVVLIIFMVTTPIIMNPSIKIQLPKATSGEETTKTELNISIAKSGKILLNAKEVNDSSLETETKALLSKNPNIQAIIAADKDVNHGTVIRVIDIVKSSGVSKFAISTEK